MDLQRKSIGGLDGIGVFPPKSTSEPLPKLGKRDRQWIEALKIERPFK
jgi:hypothetical protein